MLKRINSAFNIFPERVMESKMSDGMTDEAYIEAQTIESNISDIPDPWQIPIEDINVLDGRLFEQRHRTR
jgi:hypothetical protein